MSTQTESPLRKQLLEQARDFCEKEGITLPTLGRRVLKDTAFFARVEDGRGFTVKTFEKFQAFFRESGR